MKISGNNQNPVTKEADAGKTVTDNKKKITENTAETPDTATVRITGTTAEKIKQTLAQLPDVDQGKINEIKDLIKKGIFKINPEKIADGLTKEVMDHRASNA